MNAHRRFLAKFPALALALMATFSLSAAQAASVRDQAGMFSPAAVRQADTELLRIERETQLPTTLETIESLDGHDIAEVAVARARQDATPGLFILIAKNEKKIDVVAHPAFNRALNRGRRQTIQDTFISGFKAGDPDAALLAGVNAVRTEAVGAMAEFGSVRQVQGGAPVGRRGMPMRRGNPNGGFGLGSLLGLGLMIMAVMFVVRLIGGMFGGGYNRGMGGRMGPGGYGYGGGGGGGFMSGLFGGLGGALAGNWLYDQFSGRHHGGFGEGTAYNDPGATDAGNDWSSGMDTGGGSWGDSGGGGDWGGGGGGGDWGGGGGDGGSW